MLRNLAPPCVTTTNWKTLTVHLPACGGTARLSEGLPERWTDLQEVWRPREQPRRFSRKRVCLLTVCWQQASGYHRCSIGSIAEERTVAIKGKAAIAATHNSR